MKRPGSSQSLFLSRRILPATTIPGFLDFLDYLTSSSSIGQCYSLIIGKHFHNLRRVSCLTRKKFFVVMALPLSIQSDANFRDKKISRPSILNADLGRPSQAMHFEEDGHKGTRVSKIRRSAVEQQLSRQSLNFVRPGVEMRLHTLSVDPTLDKYAGKSLRQKNNDGFRFAREIIRKGNN